MVVMEDVTEEERSAELYVSVHGGLDHTFLNIVLRVVHTFKFLPLQVNIRNFLLDVLARGQAAQLLLSLQPADMEASQR